MLTKIFAASALVLAMGASAMAQSSDAWWWWHRDRPVHSKQVPVDRDASALNSFGDGAVGPCASDTAGPDANAGPNVNDQYCGK
ncbi:hypothetical protein [Mesorhizobium sp. AA23]|uniref:hypothetical protein n=1 Tax=Mesorhizobium sp. AA23 TaxID=1854058 RepID=UPI0007FD825F|nr:hypothetical protein [Mesorhizobium sp. AA23]OBQ90476.1 hypothetical protein A9K66_14045 [Mesorhizobium sp. AA23]